ncbi:uncharacterized protein [Temnothorax nylanderi]|uniref:uncharacterized protein n=1 Tax=Temnothorax nylanderi TaxID=102681 RepID=UPI003A88CA75
MASSADKLLAKQTQLMGSIARTMTNLKKLGHAKMTKAVLQSRITALKEKFSQSLDLDAEIRASLDVSTAKELPYFCSDQFQACEDQFDEALDYMSEVLAQVSGVDVVDLNVSHASDFIHRPTPQLPRINLPTFNGSFDRWESFRDRFKSMIIDNRNISNVDRMHYLCSSLTGDASSALNHLAITDANFTVAWNIITSRYENKRRLINGHLQTLFSLPQLASETFKDLQNLRDKANASVQALKNLDRPVDTWSDILVFLISQKLDKFSRKAWELQLSETVDYPTYDKLDKFLESRIRAFEAISPPKSETSQPSSKSKSIASHSTTTANLACPLCKSSHLLYQCPSFLAYTPSQRYEYVKKENRCINCFGCKHSMKDCKSARSCKTCHKRHHTLLHFTDDAKQASVESAPTVESTSTELTKSTANEIASHLMSNTMTPKSTVLLATARVRIYSPQGRFVYARALLDQGSVATLISENIAQRLRLAKVKQTTRITGIGESQSLLHSAAHICVTASFGDKPAFSTTAYIVTSLSKYAPNRVQSTSQWAHISDLTLADRNPMSSDPIDVIIGADLYGMLILDGVRKGNASEPIAQNTVFGWILSGPIAPAQSLHPDSVHIHHGTILENLDLDLRRFWEIEEVPHKTHLSPEEQQCEEHFAATHSRTPEGRYVVRLPFKTGPPIDLGESRFTALASLVRSERRLLREQNKAALYREFLDEYEKLGHMTKVSDTDSQSSHSQVYYIPHHAVFRESSVTTQLRVVFNASCATSNGTSLNHHLLIGPKLQRDLAAVILLWRQHQFVFTADIAKMYRQILIDNRDVDYQRILWRSSPSEPVADYRLLTVTYGTASAPYLALRVLLQLVKDHEDEFPLAALVLLLLTYVDDCTFGADNRELALKIRDQLIALLAKGGFRLRKWASNCPELLSDIDPSDHSLARDKDLHADEPLKILGVAWNPESDSFHFRVTTPPNPGQTKRAVLSTIAKLFDPLGWVTPVIVVAKIFMQRLWTLKCDWDDVLPGDLLEQWREYHSQLPRLKLISIPRWTNYGSNIADCEIHGFSDASTKAYAAVVYLRLVPRNGPVIVCILVAKSKVAPIKTISVPRLELCGALLLAQLMSFVLSNVDIPNLRYHCWIDARIVLAWLKQSPSRWKVFVANRVAKVQQLLPKAIWHHVPTADNPADCASRGLRPSELADCALWWSGPSWLKKSPEHWPTSCSSPIESEISRENRVVVHACVARAIEPWDLATRYSSWTKLLRVTAYLMRFAKILRSRLNSIPDSSAEVNLSLALAPREIQTAKIFWLKEIQGETFPQETASLTANSRVSKSSSLVALNPYLDTDGLIRVGGRLQKSDLPDSAKHPIVLQSHPLLCLIISHAHHTTLHGGPHITLAHLRTEFWILRDRATVRAVLYRCVKCAREKAIVPAELMGNLPDVRVNRSSRAFEHTGVDYAGPILVRSAKGRGHKAHKAYIALFICMTTKAITARQLSSRRLPDLQLDADVHIACTPIMVRHFRAPNESSSPLVTLPCAIPIF